jgi:DNA repair protein RecO (recombination protein O)
MFQPLFLLDLDIYYRDTRELQWIREASLLRSQPFGGADLVKSAQALFLSEVLMKSVREEERNQELFDFLLYSLGFYHSSNQGMASFHLLFLFQLSRFLGFYPLKNYDPVERPYFNLQKGSFSGFPGSGSIGQEKLLGQYWNSCFDMGYNVADQGFNNHEKRNLFLDSLLAFYDHHHPSIGKLKSLEVLRTVFGS